MPDFRITKPANLTLGVYVSEKESQRVDMNGPWRIQTGDALGAAAVSCFTQILGRALRVSSEDAFDLDSVDLIAVPEIKRFYITRRTSAGLLLQCRLIDRSKKVIYNGMVFGRGPSNEALEWSAGQAGYIVNMEEAPARAFADAFHELALDILAKVDFAAYAK